MLKSDFAKSIQHLTSSEITTPKKAKSLFFLFMGILLLDRTYSLFYFGFEYTDLDQMITWTGAVDYSQGIFHEPFFYGQAYNYMLESFIAVPLIWFGVPVYIALPIVTTIISLLPFVILAIILFKKKKYFWAYTSLIFPVFLPIEYSFLTTLSRGFIQAHFFVPFLFIPLFDPEKSKNVVILYIASALSFIANQSSVILIVPIFLYIYTYHYRSLWFYLKALLVIPFLYLDHLAKQFYIAHPERVVHKISGLEIDGKTFKESITSTDHFEFLFPFFTNWGILYFLCFALILGIAIYKFKTRSRTILFILSGVSLILITFAIPKVQTEFGVPASIFFTPSRLYLFVPILLLVSTILLFRDLKNKISWAIILFIFGFKTLIIKNYKIDKSIEKVTTNIGAGIDQNKNIIQRAKALEELSNKYQLDLILNSTSNGWTYYFDGYAFYPITRKKDVISITHNGDRRVWLYKASMNSKNILLNGFSVDTTLLRNMDYKVLNSKQIVIMNNQRNVHELLKEVNILYGTPN